MVSRRVCPVLVGLFVASREMASLRVGVAVVTVLCAMALQILSNLINDYYDFRRGADKDGRAGYARALAEGEVSERQMIVASCVAGGVAVALGVYLVLVGGWPILLIGLTSLLFAWLYTATDYSLAYLGIADIFVFLYYGVIASMGTTYLQTGAWSRTSFFAGAVRGLLSMCVLMANNLRDIEDDRPVGKRTFPVRFGKRAGEVAYILTVALTPVMSFLAFGWNASMLVIVPGIYLIYSVLTAEGSQYNKCLLMAGVVNLVYVLLVVAFN